MSRAPRTRPTERIKGPDWDDGEYVVVKTYLGSIERKEIQDAMLRVRSGEGQQVDLQTQIAAGALAKLKAGIVELHVTYSDGTEVPFTEAGLRDLPDSYVDFILDKLTELWTAWQRPAPVPTPGETPEAAAKRESFPVDAHTAAGPPGQDNVG